MVVSTYVHVCMYVCMYVYAPSLHGCDLLRLVHLVGVECESLAHEAAAAPMRLAYRHIRLG